MIWATASFENFYLWQDHYRGDIWTPAIATNLAVIVDEKPLRHFRFSLSGSEAEKEGAALPHWHGRTFDRYAPLDFYNPLKRRRLKNLGLYNRDSVAVVFKDGETPAFRIGDKTKAREGQLTERDARRLIYYFEEALPGFGQPRINGKMRSNSLPALRQH